MSPRFHVCPLPRLPLAWQLGLYGAQSPVKEWGFDALCQVILSLGKSAMGHGKMALTCPHAGSDRWLPVYSMALMAQGLRASAE